MTMQDVKWHMAYVEARKYPTGKYQLFFRGTTTEVFPGEFFYNASEARTYYKVHLMQKGQPTNDGQKS